MINVVVLQGVLARPAQDRVLPSGSRLLSLEVTIARPDGPAEPVPVASVRCPPPRRPPSDAGVEVVVVGRVRRRFFHAGGLTQSRTEVVASRVVRAAELKRAQAMMSAAGSAIATAASALGAPAVTAATEPAPSRAPVP